MRTGLAVLALAAAGAGIAVAQPYSSDRESCKKPKCVAPVLKADLAVSYPRELRDAGKQGEAVVGMTVGADGAVSDVSIVETSHVPELDAGALEAASAARFEPGRVDGKAVPMSHTIQFSFVKDSVVNLAQKTCADLNADVAFYRQTYPDAPIDEMRISTLTRGTFLLGSDAFSGGAKALVEATRKSKAAFANAVAWCEANPGGMFLERYRVEYQKG